MDYLRSCYSADMHVFQDDSTLTTRVNWTRVPPDTAPLGRPTVFVSSDWDPMLQFPPVGEVSTSRNWRNAVKGRITIPGIGLCGTDDQWANGAFTTDALPAIDPKTGLPVCCGAQVDTPCNGVVLRMGPCPRLNLPRYPNGVCPPIVVYFPIGRGIYNDLDGRWFPLTTINPRSHWEVGPIGGGGLHLKFTTPDFFQWFVTILSPTPMGSVGGLTGGNPHHGLLNPAVPCAGVLYTNIFFPDVLVGAVGASILFREIE